MAAETEVSSSAAEPKPHDNGNVEPGVTGHEEKQDKPEEANKINDSGKDNGGDDNGRTRDGNTRGKNTRGGRGGRNDNNSRGRGNFNRPRGSKYRPRGGGVLTRFDRRPESDDAGEIRRQVEFYFSDSNLPIDRFLFKEVGGKENRPVDLKVICNFKRMRHFQPFSAVVAAVKNSDFLVVNDKNEVYRKEPIPDHFTMSVEENEELLTNETMKRSIYAKGFGPESDNTAFEIEEFFEPYGIRGVRMRRTDGKDFKGSVFVEFVDEETAKRFLALDPKPQFKDTELDIKSKKTYVDEKNEAILNGEIKPRSPRRPYPAGKRDHYSGTGKRDHYGGTKRDYNSNRDHKRRRARDDEDGDDAAAADPSNWRERRDKFQEKRRKANDGEEEEEPKAADDGDDAATAAANKESDAGADAAGGAEADATGGAEAVAAEGATEEA